MANFGNFGAIQTVQAQPASKILKPWNIYKVKFAGCRVDQIKGKKDIDAVYNIFKIRFENESGYFEESIFYLNPTKDCERRSVTKTDANGGEYTYEMPSNFDRFLILVSQFMKTITSKEVFSKFCMACNKIGNFDSVEKFDAICKCIIKFTEPYKNKVETNLKLIGKTNKDGNIVTILPYFVNISRDHVPYASDAFIGDKVEFTIYETKKRKEFLNSIPTNMDTLENSKESNIMDSSNDDLQDIDTDDILSDLL